MQRAGFLLVPDREAFLFYALFFGYYPVLYAPWGGFKAGCCAMGPSFWCSTRPQCWRCSSLSMCWESPLRAFHLGLGPAVLLVLANLVFLLYDFAMDGLIVQYLRRFHDRLGRLLRGK